MKDVLVVGLSHKSAPVELRERCAVEDPEAALKELKPLAAESALLNTCNRLEVYTHRAADPDSIINWLAARAGIPAEEFRQHCYLRQGTNACKHLFFVAASLDSLVVGETQIRGQVKQAYQAAQDAGAIGPMLHRVFRMALRVSKEIAVRTGIGRGNVSVAGAAADLASRVFSKLARTQVLVLGAGETAELVISHLASRGVTSFSVLNRSVERAQELGAKWNATAGSLDELARYLPAADVLVCAAPGNPDALVSAAAMRKALRRRRGHPVVVIDIAMPRGVDPGVDRIDNVYRYGMETLTEVTQDALRHRRSDFIQCCTMVDAATLNLLADSRAHRAGELISELEQAYESVASDELKELEGKLPPDVQARVRKSVRRIVRRLLHLPKRALRNIDAEESAVIRRVFTGRDEE